MRTAPDSSPGSETVSPPLVRLASGILWSAALAASVLLVLAVTRASPSLSPAQIGFFYVLPGLVALACALVAKAEPTLRVRVALLLLALASGALMGELVATLVLTSREGVTDLRDEASAGETVLRYRAAGAEDIYPRIPGNVLVDENIGLSMGSKTVYPIVPGPGNVQLVQCNKYGGGPLIYHTDRYGFRNPDRIWDGPVEVALVGDSYTQGVCVEEDEHIGARLGRRWQTINMGMAGAGPLIELAILREYVAPEEPPIVVWIYYEGNDLYDIRGELRRSWLTAYLDPTHRQGLRGLPDLDRRYAAWIDSMIAGGSEEAPDASHPGIASVIRDVLSFESLRGLSGVGVPFPARGSPISRVPEVLARARDDVRGWGGTMFLVYLPTYERYRVRIGGGVRGRRALRHTASRLELPLIDIDSVFREYADPRELWTGPTGHLSAEGYEIVARSIAERIEGELVDRGGRE